MTEVETILKLWPLLSAAGAALGALCMGGVFWHLSKRFVKREEHDVLKQDFKALQTCVDGLSGKLTILQGKLDNLPEAGDVNRILLGLEEVRGTQQALLAKFEGQQEVLKRIEHPVQLLMAAHMDGGKHK